MSDTLETDLTDALHRRADALRVEIPDPAALRSSSKGHRRSRRPAIAIAAAALVAVGGVFTIGGSDRDLLETVTEPTDTPGPALTTLPPTAAPTTTVSLPPVDNDGPLLLGAPLTFIEAKVPELGALEWANWAGLVGDTFVVAGPGADEDQSHLVVSEDAVTWRSIEVPTGHRVLEVNSLGADLVVFTYDPEAGGGQRWRLGDTLEPLDLLGDLELPEHPDPPRRWGQVNRPLFFSVDGRVHALVGAVETVDLVDLAERAGLIRPEERVCELVGEGLVYTLSLSSTAETDRECLASSDLRDVLVTPATLGVSDTDFLLYDQRGQDRTFVVRWEDEGPPTVLAELEGLPGRLVVDGSTVTASLSSDTEAGGFWLATASDASDWTIIEAPGPVVALSAGVGWSGSASRSADDPSALFRVDSSGIVRLGDLPANVETPSIGKWGDSDGAFPVIDTVDLTSAVEQRGVLVTSDGVRWRFGDLSGIEAPGGEQATAAIGDRLLVYEMSNPTSIWIADVDE